MFLQPVGVFEPARPANPLRQRTGTLHRGARCGRPSAHTELSTRPTRPARSLVVASLGWCHGCSDPSIRPSCWPTTPVYPGAGEETSGERVAECHAAYMEQLGAVLPRPASRRCRLCTGPRRSVATRLPDDYDRGGRSPSVDGQWVVDLPSVQAFWAAENDPRCRPDRPAPTMQCLACGAGGGAAPAAGQDQRVPGADLGHGDHLGQRRCIPL